MPASLIKKRVCIIHSGVCALVIGTENGKSIGVATVNEGQLINLMGIVGDTEKYKESFNYGHYGIALQDVTLCTVPMDVMRKLFKESADFAWLYLIHLVDRHKDTISHLERRASLSAEEHVSWLLENVRKQGGDPNDLTHENIARILGMTRVGVTRIMHRLNCE